MPIIYPVSADTSRKPPLSRRALPSVALALCPTALAAQSAPQPVPPGVMGMTFNPFQLRPSIGDAVTRWENMRTARGVSFDQLADFLLAHPGWPNERDMRDAAEAALIPEREQPRRVIAFFQRFPARLPAAQLRYAEALYTLGQRDLAKNAARLAWVGGAMSTDDESRMFIRFTDALTSDDHDARMDRLLWDRAVAAAQRQLPYTSAARRPLFDARLALLSKAADAEAKAGPFVATARTDPGFLADRVTYLANMGREADARALLAQPHEFTTPPRAADVWVGLLLKYARRAEADGDWATAYNIARQVGDAYPQGTVLRSLPLNERDPYTSLIWLAADTAFSKLGRFGDATLLFARYAEASRSGTGQAKGLYWAARAATAGGQTARAQDYANRAATFFETFHGQLAAEMLGRAPALPPGQPVTITAQQRNDYEAGELFRAAQYLGANGLHAEQSLFLRALASGAQTDTDLGLASDEGAKIGRIDLGVMAGRVTRGSGGADFVRASFPQIPVDPAYQLSWTMIHAISRQESNFDIGAVSRTSARGLMQIEPYTARTLATKNGLTLDIDRLTRDPAYNTSFGAIYFSQLMTRFGGCYVCAIGAYNAGPGRIDQWSARNGDPRAPSTDMIKWIEAIPFTETRGYVQHVIENAVVYDLLNPHGPNVRTMKPVSHYLGR